MRSAERDTPALGSGRQLLGALIVTTANASAQEIIMVNGTSSAKLNQTMSKKPLPAGQYLMNIVVGSNTSRVTFTVQ